MNKMNKRTCKRRFDDVLIRLESGFLYSGGGIENIIKEVGRNCKFIEVKKWEEFKINHLSYCLPYKTRIYIPEYK